MRLATNPSPAPTSTATFPSRLPSLSSVAATCGAVAGVRTELQQAHGLRGVEEMHTGHICGRPEACASVARSRNEVLLARMAPALHTAASRANTSLFAVQVLRDRLHDQVRAPKVCVVQGEPDQREPTVGLGLGKAAATDHAGIDPGDGSRGRRRTLCPVREQHHGDARRWQSTPRYRDP